MMTKFNKILTKFYYDPSLPSALGGRKNLYNHIPNKKIDKTIVNKWLSGQDTYTLHKPITRKFPRRNTIVSGINYQFQADLIDVQNISKDNDGYKFILTCIDVFSKRAWAIPIKNKSGHEVSTALSVIFNETSPLYLQTDKGKEFFNNQVKQLLHQFNVNHFTTENESIKASIVERFNRTLRSTFHRYFTKTGRERYIDVLPDLVTAYNSRYHSSLGTSPLKASSQDQEELWYKLYDPKKAFENPLPKLKEGDYVRISKARTPFQRGYTPNWSVEVFRIAKILPTTPPTYSLEDYNKEPILGSFYHHELQKIQKPSTYKIEKILQHKQVNGETMVLVKWLGYPNSFNEWIPKASIIDN